MQALLQECQDFLDLLNAHDLSDMEKPGPGFFAELDHLVKGIMGKTGVYSDTVPAFAKHEGVKAARLRSSDLSRMARKAQKYLDRYHSGLEKDIINIRSINKNRILKYFKATELEWEVRVS